MSTSPSARGRVRRITGEGDGDPSESSLAGRIARNVVIECNQTYPHSMAPVTPRPALEVFVNEIGTITIRQDADAQSPDEAPLVVVHPEDVSTLIRALEEARRKARRGRADEREEVTVPAFVYPSRPQGSH
jgi:hypothetical protein